MVEPSLLTLPDGRLLGFDDAGDPDGVAVLYLHGMPDCRLGRHPDDGIAADLRVRLLAVDWPGVGASSVDPAGSIASFAGDVVALATHLGLDQWSVFAWSAGAMPAFAVAATAPEQVRRVGVVGGLPPIQAFDDPSVHAAASDHHRLFADMAHEMDAAALAASIAPMMLPWPLTLELAREAVLEGADELRIAELGGVPGIVEQLALAKVETVRRGLTGITNSLACQATRSDVDLAAVTSPIELWYGSKDITTPPPFGRWFADQLRNADLRLHVVADAGHTLLFPRWAELLAAVRR